MLQRDYRSLEGAVFSPDNLEKFEKFVSDIPPSLSSYLKREFEKNLPSLLGRSVKMELALVVDASQIIAEVLSLVRKGQSLLSKIATEPFLRLYAPPALETEMEREIPKVAEKVKMDPQTLLMAWRSTFKPIIHIAKPDQIALFSGYLVLGKRDPSDVPYLALALRFEMQGVVSRDADILDQGVVRTWKIGRVKKVVTIMKRGSLMFVVSSQIVIPALIILFEIALSFIRAIFEIALEIAAYVGSILRRAFGAIERSPTWVQVAVGLAVIFILLWEKSRNKIAEVVGVIANAFAEFFDQLTSALRNFIEFLAPFAGLTLVALAFLFEGISQAIEEIRSIKLN